MPLFRINAKERTADVIRCPVLELSPDMLPRLDEIEEDLLARRNRAEHEGWLGEIEGIDLTLTFLAQRRAEALRR